MLGIKSDDDAKTIPYSANDLKLMLEELKAPVLYENKMRKNASSRATAAF